MTQPDHAYKADLLALAAEKHAGGAIDRRGFLQALAGLGLVVAPGMGTSASAAPSELVLCNFGGIAAIEYKKAFGPGFQKATGLNLVVDGAGANNSKIRAMVQAKATSWDVCDLAPTSSVTLGREGMLETIDYAVVDKDQLLPGYALDYGCAAYVFSFILAYDKTKLPTIPTTWTDFLDFKKFPGKRTLYKNPSGQMEALLLASGVAPDKLYPLDMDRACAKLKEIKDQIIFWDSGAQSQQLFRDRDVTMGNIWHTRATVLKAESNGSTDFTWNGGIVWVGGWMIPKNNPAGRDNANKFIRASQDAAAQVQLFKALANGPANPKASDLIPPELRVNNPTQPENLKLQIISNPTWWAENLDTAQERWLDALT